MSKKVIVPVLLWDGVDLAGAPLISPSTNVLYLDAVSLQVDFQNVTGSGLLVLQGRITQPSNIKNYESPWQDLSDLIPDTVITSASTSYIFDITDTALTDFRIKIVSVSNLTGTVYYTLAGKSKGA